MGAKPRVLIIARESGHSDVLWNPNTTKQDVDQKWTYERLAAPYDGTYG
jgi:hypothetical protein